VLTYHQPRTDLGQAWFGRRSPWSWVFALVVAMTGGILFFSWYAAIEHGPRHYLDAWPGLMILSAVGLHGAAGFFRRIAGRAGTNAFAIAIAGLYVTSIVLYIPLRVNDLVTRHLGVDPRVHEVAQQQVRIPAVVFMQCPSEPADFYCSGFVHNDPFLEGPIIYARHISAQADSMCLGSFPGRTGYLMTYDPPSGAIEVVALPYR
jgi:hypothetical protein